MSKHRIPEVLLFDLGGVLLDIDFGRAFQAWGEMAGVAPALLAARYRTDEAYERHERGQISASEYYACLRESLQVALTDAQFEAGWNALLLAEKREITGLIAQLPRSLPLYVFSNSNLTHQRHWMRQLATLLPRFERIFVSSDIGLRKPEREAYAHVAREIGAAPADILFFDDSLPNVEGARHAGLHAVHVTSAEAVRAALRPYL
jgi:putative hydrolase of the HAD superfamily